VVSFYGRDLQRYTAFKIHPPSEGPIRQFLFHDKGVIALGTRSVHMAMRRGPALWNIRYDHTGRLGAMEGEKRSSH
jgi:PAB-dependent poly(A)-specific ribonuclease subunit 2